MYGEDLCIVLYHGNDFCMYSIPPPPSKINRTDCDERILVQEFL